ncbi:hypothetical protein C8Q69DRAFT_504545 [Paecilomyces variotii]|uniref:DUF221 domain protein n=1 Tax=Byssochlamys spectabilis TaxID=264951 RepID=A0A443I1E0_BYSSP|nr:hypothetical protein C8Q69DRAFT_504545 [Paecilomyces variotii]KAJ9247646.1 hypothetical protein DTO195F2_9089 [Paecilomyces variotii]KAJ9321738.1 hypothetical protein DTO027B3_7263 [Paecilomyces variotii]KAJ9330003.1 hypothetical protein DTO027B5_8214 [Paecilomyces variotii]KAJ9350786.1 hypothetical protein DTO280E4_8515 [Paecilomyces variotii]KAJ9398451.1 hypothetical protein DTO282F9_4542 [Paecilomyces variotii]
MEAYDEGIVPIHYGLFRRQSDSDSTQNTSNSASGLVSTLVVNLVISGAMVLLFVLLRRREKRTYMPRTYLGTLRQFELTPPSSTGLIGWIKDMYRLPDTYVLQHHSMDAYFLLRYLKIVSIICFVGCLVTWPVLFSVNATGGGGKQQLDILSISNVSNTFGRYYAHCFISWIFVGYIFFTITRESIYYINVRQAYALSPPYANRISSRTVLFTSVPQEYLSEAKIRRMFGDDRVQNVWVATDVKKLDEKVQEREKAAMKLEAAEISLIKMANKERQKSMKGQPAEEEMAHLDNTVEDDRDAESGSVAARWVKANKRPTHRLKFLIGKKVDTINWARSEIERLTPEIEELQARHRAGDAKLVSSVFVEFYTQTDAQSAFQSVAHNLPLHMAPRYIGLDPTQIIWSNLRIKWWELVIRYAATIAFVTAMVIFWAIPTAVAGAISNINFLTNKVPFLKFINHVPKVILGVITGLLPTVIMAVLMALVPIILRLMAKLGGCPSLAAVELRTQNFYFCFQVVQVFLVVTLASAATSVTTKIIENPTSAASLLAQNIPLSSNFYISYIILQGLSFSSGALLQIVGLILSKVLGKVLDNSPRKMYKRWATLSGLGWGTVFPVFTLLTVIAITYSCIAPLVLGFATIGLYLFYFAYRYNLLYVSNAEIDTQGKVYPRALQQTTTGCYLLVVCLIGLFAIGTGSDRMAVGPLVLEIIFLIFLILYHLSLNSALEPLINYLPKNLEAEEQGLLELERSKLGQTNSSDPTSSVPDGDYPDKVDSVEKGLHNTALPAPHKKPSILAKFLRPDKYTDYATMRRLVPNTLDSIQYPPEVERDAYFHPAITSQAPLLWIPRDPAGVSRQEVKHSLKVIPITDEDSWLDEKNKVHWNSESGRPPIYEEKIYY